MHCSNTPRHILLFNRSFWPDIEATGQFLTQLCEQLAKKYRVTVVVGRSYYVKKDSFGPFCFCKRETLHGIEILRVRHTRFWKGRFLGRITNWLTYSLLAFIVALRLRPDLIIACTDPPFVGVIAFFISRLKSVPFIYNCRDLFPDVALELGRLQPGLRSRMFDSLNKKALSAASVVVCLGQSMKERIEAKGIAEHHLMVIPDWADTTVIKPVPKENNHLLEKFNLRDTFVIMYSGNIGLSQDFNSLLHALTRVEEHFPFYLVFVGEGSGKRKLRRQTQSLGFRNAVFLSYQSIDTLSYSLSMADLHLVPLKKGMAGASVPSKVYGIMAAGRPYLAIADRESEPVRFVEEYRCGFWAPPGDVRKISDVIMQILGNTRELEEMGRRARNIAQERFDKNVVVSKWFALLDSQYEGTHHRRV
jgi:glycosyltransferase involved in cell wall biosynthesis